MRTLLLTSLAMLAFAANSLLARLALSTSDADALGYTGIRLASGAIALAAILWFAGRREGVAFRIGGNWRMMAALSGYALAFSTAYLMLGAGTGALILFASVQFGILGTALYKGERPGPMQWAGILLALLSLFYLLAPGLAAPDPLGAALMIAAGVCWAAYTLLGRGSSAPLADTAGNFIRSLPLAVLLASIGLAIQAPSANGVMLAVGSGALASGVGYAIWYAALSRLTRSSAALVQLTVPALAALGGRLLLGEPLTLRVVLATGGILGGVALALLAASRVR
jgi:drug/metabolite transporter (DMT)-like permease